MTPSPSRTADLLETLADALERVAECRTPGCDEYAHAAECPAAQARAAVRELRAWSEAEQVAWDAGSRALYAERVQQVLDMRAEQRRLDAEHARRQRVLDAHREWLAVEPGSEAA